MPDSHDLRDLEFDSGMTPELRWSSLTLPNGLGSCFSDSSCSRPETHDWRDLDLDMAFRAELRCYSTACSTASKFRYDFLSTAESIDLRDAGSAISIRGSSRGSSMAILGLKAL